MAGHEGYLQNLSDLQERAHLCLTKLFAEMRDLHIRKATDYGSDADPMHNLRATQEIGIEPWRGAYLRAKDKVKRIDQFCLKGTLANESVEDSFMDLAAYSLLALTLRREELSNLSVEDRR